MIETIQEAIITQLETIEGVPLVEGWQGDIEDLLKMPKRLPALYVIYQGAEFEPFEQAGDLPTAALSYVIVLIARNLKSREAGSSGCYALIEAVRTKLIGYQIEDYDFLRPVREELILAAGGVLAYGMTYQMSNVLWEGA